MPEYSKEIARILTGHDLDPGSVKISLYELHPKSLIAVVREYGTLLGCGQGTTHGTAVYAAMVNRRLRLMFTRNIQDRLATLERRLNEQRRLLPHFIVDSWGARNSAHRWSIRLYSGELLLAQVTANSLVPTMRQLLDSAHKTLSKTTRLPHLLAEITAERGTENERRVQATVNHLRQQISWITDVRCSTEREEARGIDLIVETDQGRILLQVKSSLIGREAFLRDSSHDPNILVIVADDEETDESLKKTLSILFRHRYAALSK